ncbi:MAG: transaldolase [Pseudomonadales bacterium]|nr:MAG: transaldolase [Pseudomonadales bacterium]
MTALTQLKQMTTIVADTGDLETIARLKPLEATTNPSLITKALTAPEKQALLAETMSKYAGDIDKVIDELTIQVGCDILQVVEGRVSTEVDARLSYDSQGTIDKALQYIDAYAKAGIDKERVLIKVASTWEGIKAAEQLEKQGIHCNLTLLFGMHQAVACADAGITLISPFVGRILDWQKAEENRTDIPVSEDMGVLSVSKIYNYYKQHGYNTQVMGASFRSSQQILALAGCDLLTISPNLIDELDAMDVEVVRKLSPEMAQQAEMIEKLSFDKDSFTTAQEEHAVSKVLLPKGIDGFVKAREELVQALRA